MRSDDSEVPQARLLMGSARTSDVEMVNNNELRNRRVSQRGLLARSAEEEFPTARYHVEVKLRVSPRFGIVGSSPAITPPPFLRQFAPFPYGTASVPRTWEPISRHPVYLSVPPLYDSDQADQVDPLSCRDAEHDESHASVPVTLLAGRTPMSLKGRFAGCVGLFLGRGLPPCFFGFHIAMFYPIMRESLFALVFMGGIYLALMVPLFGVMVAEARASQLGRILTAEQVEVDDVAEFLSRRGADDAPVIEFLVSSKEKKTQTRKWSYDHHEDEPQPSEDVVSHARQLSSTYDVVRLRLWVKVALANDQTRGDFMTALHSFYLDTLPHSLTVNVLDQDHAVAITRSVAGLPRYFRVLCKIFPLSTYLTLSWIPRILVLLFYPHLVDPAFSPAYCHQKRLVSRAAST